MDNDFLLSDDLFASETTEEVKEPDSLIIEETEIPEELPSESFESELETDDSLSLRIEGKLSPSEQDAVLDILADEEIQIDHLATQFEKGRLLVPRITAFTGIRIIQRMKNIEASLHLAASHPDNNDYLPAQQKDLTPALGEDHPAFKLPLTRDPYTGSETLNTLAVTGVLTTYAVEAEATQEYQILLDRLLQELRLRAYYKKAKGIYSLSIQLQLLFSPTQYRLLVTGTITSVT